MITITLTQEELNECLQAVQESKELVMQMPKDDYILNVIIKDEMILVNFSLKDGELVLFNIITQEGKLLFDEEVVFIFILKDVIKAGTKNGEVISIDNIVSK